MLLSNSRFLNANAAKLNSELLRQQSRENSAQAKYIDDANWTKTRKLMKRGQAAVEQQQSGYSTFGGRGYGGKGAVSEADR